MKKVLLNVSNHPSPKWGKKQMKAVEDDFGCSLVRDIPFPPIPSDLSTEGVIHMARDFYATYIRPTPEDEYIVHLMGEQSFCFFLAEILLAEGISVVVSTTERKAVVETLPDGTIKKEAVFEFVQFRDLFQI